MRTRFPTLLATVLALGLAGSLVARGRRPADAPTLVLVDSKGSPADDLALAAYRASRDRRSKVRFRWLRLGSPHGPSPRADGRDPAPAVLPQDPAQAPLAGPGEPSRPSPVTPEWDEDGSLTRGFDLDGVPRLLVVDAAGKVLRREVFLPPEALRYVCRHPEGDRAGRDQKSP